jgi:hypothetical protein
MGRSASTLALVLLLFFRGGSSALAQIAQDVLTSHNDIYRSGVYASEKTLKPENVNRRTFGIAFARQVIGQIWGQPLYVHGAAVDGKLHNVVYGATSENYIYAFDADDMSTSDQTPPLKKIWLGKPSSISSGVFGTIYPSNGISSTPVIDIDPNHPGNGTLYLVAKIAPDSGDAKFHIFALNLATLAIAKQATIDASTPRTTGANPSIVKFYDSDHLNRPALLIVKNHLVVAFGSGPNNDQDGRSYHGWVMSYSLPNLDQTGVFITTPNSGMGGIWQAGAGPAADDQGNVYVMSGNGHFQDTVSEAVHPDLADSFIKLDNSTGKLTLADWYTPPSRDFMEACDMDLGASGPGVIPDAGFVFGAGKTGLLYVRNKDRMGKTDPPLANPAQWTGTPDCSNGQCFRVAQNVHGQHMVQQKCDMSGFPFSTSTGFNRTSWNATLNSYPHVHGAPVLWKSSPKVYDLYVWPEEDFLKEFKFNGETFDPNPIGKSAPVDAANMSMPGGVLSLSWDGSNPQTAILWASRPNPMAPKAVSGPFVNSFTAHDQEHFAYRDANGIVWDEYYCPGCNDANGSYPWRLQQINCGAASDSSCKFKNVDAVSAAPAADAGPFVITYTEHDQQHFVFKSHDGGVWDVFYCPGCSGNTWREQRINMGSLTSAPPAVGPPFVNVYSGHDQMHYVYRATNGEIWDVFYCPGCSNGAWRAQQLNCGPSSDSSCTLKTANALTGAPAAVDGPTVNTYTEHDQQHFAYVARGGAIWDIFYCPACSGGPWRTQRINMSGGTAGGPAAVEAPAIAVYSGHDQQHFVYRDVSGAVQDAYYCPGCSNGNWRLQQINCGPQSSNACAAINANATSAAPPAADGPALSLYSGHDQMHYAFKDRTGVVQDVFYCPGCNDGSWHLQEINAPGLTAGPPAAAAPSIDVYLGHDQQHFAYRDATGNMWDAFACPGCSDGYWQLQKITPCGDVMTHMSDLTPNDAPCNAINKLVHGYLQAFKAVPSASGQLQELWNSDESPGDVVRWFSKESPPTIADGKVFLAEFPPKPMEGRWNANTALGRLLVYAVH